MRTTRADGSLWIVDERRGGRRVITALGRIDGRTAPRLVSALARDEADEPVALDLGAVEIGDGPGPLLLLHAMRHLHARQRGLILLSAQPALRRALDSSGLARRFELIEEGAVGGPRPPPSAATGPGHRAALRRRRVSAGTAARRAALLADATLAIEQRHAEPDLAPAEIAREIGASGRQLERVFADLAGSTCRGEITAIRMHHAAVLLQSTDLRLVDIARSVGYRDFAQFSEAFRRYHAVTPGALRRAGRDDAAPMG